MRKLSAALVCIAFMLLFLSTQAKADIKDYWRSYLSETESHLLDLKHEMQQIEPSKWEPALVEDYLASALWIAYIGTIVSSYEAGNVGLSNLIRSDDIIADGFVSVWPGNPFADWRPMAILAPSDGFSPGDLTLQYSYDYFGSFEAGVYGPDEDMIGLRGAAAPLAQNQGWAVVPNGSLFMMGFNVGGGLTRTERQSERTSISE